jgi:hypothetical protein
MPNSSNLNRDGGAASRKINLDEIKEEVKKELLEIEAMNIEQSPKTKRFTRLARKIKNDLRGNKTKFTDHKTGKYDPKKQIALKTYHGYLTQIRNMIKMLNIKHHSLPAKIHTLSKRYPEYATLLESILNEPARSVGAIKAQVMKQIQSNTENPRRAQAYKDVKVLKVDHDVINRLVKDDVEIADRAESEARALSDKKKNTVTLNHHDITRMISELITQNAYSKRAVGLALACGRRATEILYTADFKVAGKNIVTFSGQTKKRYGTQVNDYEIYTLIPAKEFVKRFYEFRNLDSIKEIHADTNKKPEDVRNKYINSRTAKTMNDSTKREFNDNTRTFKDSRGIYTRICLDRFFGNDEKWNNSDEDEFLKSLLGHSDYKDQRNYKQFKIDYNAKIEAPKVKIEQITPKDLIAPLNDIDGEIQDTDRKPMIALHERVKAWTANNPTWKLSQTVMSKPKGVGKIGGSRPLIKAYLVIAEQAIEAYNADK